MSPAVRWESKRMANHGSWFPALDIPARPVTTSPLCATGHCPYAFSHRLAVVHSQALRCLDAGTSAPIAYCHAETRRCVDAFIACHPSARHSAGSKPRKAVPGIRRCTIPRTVYGELADSKRNADAASADSQVGLLSPTVQNLPRLPRIHIQGTGVHDLYTRLRTDNKEA